MYPSGPKFWIFVLTFTLLSDAAFLVLSGLLFCATDSTLIHPNLLFFLGCFLFHWLGLGSHFGSSRICIFLSLPLHNLPINLKFCHGKPLNIPHCFAHTHALRNWPYYHKVVCFCKIFSAKLTWFQEVYFRFISLNGFSSACFNFVESSSVNFLWFGPMWFDRYL